MNFILKVIEDTMKTCLNVKFCIGPSYITRIMRDLSLSAASTAQLSLYGPQNVCSKLKHEFVHIDTIDYGDIDSQNFKIVNRKYAFRI